MSSHQELTDAGEEHKHPNYFGVFIALAVITAIITAVELMEQNGVIHIPRPALNTAFIIMSLTKAVLVALFYMHLKYDSLLYTVLFGLPVLFAIVFFTLLLI